MILYFYDEVATSLIAYDTEAKNIRELRAFHTGAPGPAEPNPRNDAKLFPTKHNKEMAAAGRTGKKVYGCSVCSQPGHNAKTCPQNRRDGALPKDNKRETAMSRMTFGRVKISQSHAIPASTIANNLDVSEAEIEKAFTVETYDAYLRI